MTLQNVDGKLIREPGAAIEAFMSSARDCYENQYPGTHWPEYVFTDMYADALNELNQLLKVNDP